MIEPIVTLDTARRLEETGRDVVWADVRWYLDGRPGRPAYEAGHLPGAVFVDLDRDLAAHGLPATAGRHPFPSSEAFAEALGRLGIGDDALVVAYDDTGGMTAGRLVWMLRILGFDAALLDGGIGAWLETLETGTGTPRPSVVRSVVPWPADRLVSADEIARLAASGPASGAVALDARGAERFRGDEAVAVDPRRGHIPGARNAPWAANVDPSTLRFRGVDELTEHYARLGVAADTTAVCSCGSGVSACADLLALEYIGVRDTRLFVASWSGWSADAHRPAALGPA